MTDEISVPTLPNLSPPIVDPATGKMATVWVKYFTNLNSHLKANQSAVAALTPPSDPTEGSS